ncbi:MAG: hypothetical protein JRG81_11455 [Deltaproteobacteria bacterium]|nr:hypothetical protein [Deltaproteobacteria bacterium]
MPIHSFEEMVEILREDLGSHSHVARALGLTVRHYLRLRTIEQAKDKSIQTMILMRIYCKIIGLSRTHKRFRNHKRELVREWTSDHLTKRKIRVLW